MNNFSIFKKRYPSQQKKIIPSWEVAGITYPICNETLATSHLWASSPLKKNPVLLTLVWELYCMKKWRWKNGGYNIHFAK
jgi:hypothetical protein